MPKSAWRQTSANSLFCYGLLRNVLKWRAVQRFLCSRRRNGKTAPGKLGLKVSSEIHLNTNSNLPVDDEDCIFTRFITVKGVRIYHPTGGVFRIPKSKLKKR